MSKFYEFKDFENAMRFARACSHVLDASFDVHLGQEFDFIEFVQAALKIQGYQALVEDMALPDEIERAAVIKHINREENLGTEENPQYSGRIEVHWRYGKMVFIANTHIGTEHTLVRFIDFPERVNKRAALLYEAYANAETDDDEPIHFGAFAHSALGLIAKYMADGFEPVCYGEDGEVIELDSDIDILDHAALADAGVKRLEVRKRQSEQAHADLVQIAVFEVTGGGFSFVWETFEHC